MWTVVPRPPRSSRTAAGLEVADTMKAGTPAVADSPVADNLVADNLAAGSLVEGTVEGDKAAPGRLRDFM